MPVDLSSWPRTLWVPDGADRACCVHCKRDNSYHGASEVIATKLGFRINQQHEVCRPIGDRNPEVPKALTVQSYPDQRTTSKRNAHHNSKR